MKLLVTGGAGFIGSHVCDLLLAEGHQVVIIDNLSSGNVRYVHPSSVFHELDLSEHDRVKEILLGERPEGVLHLAAQKSVSASVDDPIMDLEENVVNSLHLFEGCRAAGVQKIVFASTGGALYGETDELPTPETHPTFPESPYGVAKLSVEHYLRFYEKVHGMEAAILRMANVYGPRQDPLGEAGVVAIFCSRVIAGRPVSIFGDGLQTRDYTYVKDAAAAFVAALAHEGSLTVNVGTATETSLLDLVDTLSDVAGADIGKEHLAPRPGEIRRSCLAYDLASKELGWRPRFGLREGLAETLEHFKSSP